jgi:hypothetical protein
MVVANVSFFFEETLINSLYSLTNPSSKNIVATFK